MTLNMLNDMEHGGYVSIYEKLFGGEESFDSNAQKCYTSGKGGKMADVLKTVGKNAEKRGMDQKSDVVDKEADAEKELQAKHNILNWCVLFFVAVMTSDMLVTFFILVGRDGYSTAASGIASTYVLCMLLAAPTLKVFLDKVESRMMKRVNVVGIVSIFVAILVVVVTVFVLMVL